MENLVLSSAGPSFTLPLISLLLIHNKNMNQKHIALLIFLLLDPLLILSHNSQANADGYDHIGRDSERELMSRI